VAKIKTVWQTAVSPNGKQVAYTVAVQRQPLKDPDGAAWTELHVLRDNGKSRRYVGGKTSVRSVSWSPSGKQLLFLTSRKGDKGSALYSIEIDGGEAHRVLNHKGSIRGYALHPDGKQVAYLATPADSAAAKKNKASGFTRKIYEESEKNTHVWLSTLNAAKPATKPMALPGSASSIAISPDGKTLSVALAPTPLVDDHYMNRNIHLVDLKSHKVKVRIKHPGKLSHVVWSPDSKHLAALAAGDRHDPYPGRLTVANAQTGTFKDILPALTDGQVSSVAWLNAKTLIYTTAIGTQTTVETVAPDGSGRKVLVSGKAEILSSLTASNDGKRVAFVGDSPSHPREVFTWTVGSGAPKRATTHNRWLSKVKFGKQETVTYKARDGLEIQGVLIHPVNRKKNQRVPLIMMIHGGPESHFRNGWVTGYGRLGQMAAAKGWAIFHPNYRGSTGRGVEFSKGDHGDPAGKEFDDIVDGIDHLAKMGLVDKDKVGIMGGSYGGYAAAWGATYYTDRYKAACVFVGVTDQISKVGTTDITQEMYLVHFRKYPWDHWDFFLKRSPIYHAQKTKTATLILHGDSDKRVDPGQSRELFRHIKVRSKAPVRLVIYPGEGHGNRKAAARLDYSLRTLRWMEHYLVGPGGKKPPIDLDYKKAMQQ